MKSEGLGSHALPILSPDAPDAAGLDPTGAAFLPEGAFGDDGFVSPEKTLSAAKLARGGSVSRPVYRSLAERAEEVGDGSVLSPEFPQSLRETGDFIAENPTALDLMQGFDNGDAQSGLDASRALASKKEVQLQVPHILNMFIIYDPPVESVELKPYVLVR